MARHDKLVYDIGLHRGEDTEFYLKKGFKVVAIEANPSLVSYCTDRFAQQIQSGQLHIIQGAVAAPTGADKIKFYLDNNVSVWGTVDPAWAARNAAQGSDSTEIEVNQINMIDVFEKFGVPFYLKIDIEGADGLVLEALQHLEYKPQFLSIEANTVELSSLLQDLKILSDLGYKQFQLVPQQNIGGTLVDSTTIQGDPIIHLFADGSSGVFGNELTGVWIDHDAVIASFSPPFDHWQDIHASLSQETLVNVALNRPATQSSTSPWSTHADPVVDAQIANNGDVNPQKYFHTSLEIGPWWQVDLESRNFIDKIVLYNRDDARDRLMRFTVLGSVNGNKWTTIFRKSDDKSFSIFATNLSSHEAVQFVRVRLDGHNFLHFCEIKIFGRPVVSEMK